MTPIVPAPDPIGLPAPAWLLETLLVATLPLHLLMMNLTLGGSIVAAWAAWRGRGASRHKDLAREIARLLPVTTSLTITLGVAPLLFLQVLYGQAFYTSSILMAWSWLAVVALLLAAYYALYLFSFRAGSRRARKLPILAATLLLAIGFVFTNNMTLMLRPESWYALYQQSEFGTHLNLDDPTLGPRFLHSVVAALAVTGLGLTLLARRRDGDWGRDMLAIGRRLFVIGTHAQILVGIGLFLLLPRHVRESFLGGSPLETTVLWSAIGGALLATILVRRSAPGAAGLLMAVVFGMTYVRHRVRALLLAPYFPGDSRPCHPQYALLVLFLILLVVGIVLLIWIAQRFFRVRAESG